MRGAGFWAGKGFKTDIPPRAFKRAGYHAGSIAERAQAVNALFREDKVAAIQVLWGVYGSKELIPHLDWDLIRARPKPLIGRSDITALHLAFARYAGFPTFYGPGLAQIAPAEPSAFTQNNLLKCLTSPEPLGELPRHPKDSYQRVLSPGQAKGPIKGGCLWPLCKSIGTPWQPDLEGAIFFFEEIGEPPWSIDAHLTHLSQAGLMDGVVGVAIGRMVDCEWSDPRAKGPSEFGLEDVLEKHFEGLSIPVIYGVLVGHEKDTLTIPLGVEAEIKAGSLSVLQSPFAA